MDPFADLNANFNQNRLNDFHAAQQQAQAPQQHAPVQHGNFFTHLLPTIGGTVGGVGGGAVGGALAGTAILPGVGTALGGLLGALLGGSAGGAAGKVAENKVEGQGAFNHPGDILKQGLEQGALSAGPLRLLKGAGVAGKTLLTAGEDAAGQAAGDAATKGGSKLMQALNAGGTAATGGSNLAKNLITQGEQAQGRVAGLSAGTRDASSQFGRLSPQDTSQLLGTLKSEGINVGNANNMSSAIQSKMGQYGKQIAQHFADNNSTVNSNDLANEFLNNVTLGGMKTSDPGVLKAANTLANDLKTNVNDTKSLWDFRRSLDSRLPDSKLATDTNLANTQAATKSLRQFIAGKLGDVPGMSNYSKLSDVQQHVLEEANRLNNPGGGIVGRVAASGPVQKAEASLGKVTAGTGQALANPYSLLNVGSRTVPVGALQAATSAIPQNPSMATTSSTMNAPMKNDNIATSNQNTDGLSSMPGDASQSSSPYTQQGLMYDIARDPANAAKYISTYDSLDKIFNPASSSTAPKPTNQQYGLAQSGMNALQQLSGMVSSDPNVVNQNAVVGQGLPLVGSLISNAAGAGQYHPLADSVLQSLIHLETGATATPEEVKAAKGQLPQPGDSADERQRKIANLMSVFQNYLGGAGNQSSNTGNTTATNPTDLASALSALGYGQ